MDFTSEDNYEVTKLLQQMIENIRELTKETVLARGKVVSVADEIDSSNWESDMFSNLVGDFSDSNYISSSLSRFIMEKILLIQKNGLKS